jgi:hypothetical protein
LDLEITQKYNLYGFEEGSATKYILGNKELEKLLKTKSLTFL